MDSRPVAPRTPPSALLPALAGYAGYLDSVNASAARAIGAEFGLGDAALASLFGWAGFASVGAFFLSRLADRAGRRRVILLCVALAPPAALAGALAPGAFAFLLAMLVVGAAKGTLANTLPVVVTETAPASLRARRQALLGVVGIVGNGAALVAVTLVLEAGTSWRWAWALAALPILAWPFVARTLPETPRFAGAGADRNASLRELVRPPLRRLTFGTVAVQALLQIGFVAAMGWMIYHPTQHRGLSQAVVTTYVVAGGVLGLAGVVLAGRLADRIGRRATFCAFAVLLVAATLAYYGLPASLGSALVPSLALAYAVMSASAAGAGVVFRTAVTELFPTRLRASVLGVHSLALALSLAASNLAAGALAGRLGGIGPAVSVLVGSWLVAALVYALVLPETRGRALDGSTSPSSPPSGS